MSDVEAPSYDRRTILRKLSGLGIGSVVFQRALAAEVESAQAISPEMIQQAEWIAGITLSEEDREQTASAVQRQLLGIQAMHAVDVPYEVAPAIAFHPPAPGEETVIQRQAHALESAAGQLPKSQLDLAFLPVTELAALIRTRKISSMELTKMYLERLHEFDQQLHCVVNFTEDVALRQARRADREIGAGRYRGPLHGIPWGAKDLIDYPGYPTTWGAVPFREQKRENTATVARRLEEAGAVLVAKLSLGALAMGDRWFGGMTRNPWDVKQGSSGSSAGSAAATAAGLVGFTLGSETLGSIVSPCRRCGTSGLRPTFGRVSRYGCMPLSWSMDKIGPICRSIEDCALVFDTIHGRDGLDGTVVDRPFQWPSGRDIRTLRVGYIPSRTPDKERNELAVLKELGVQLVPIELPQRFPANAMTLILDAEAATVFDELTRQGVTEGLNQWPKIWRAARYISAVEYLRANRLRAMLMVEMNKLFQQVDLYVGGNDLVITNLTGHPTAVLPDGFTVRDDVRRPYSITFTGSMYGESDLLAVAQAYQQVTGHHLERPGLEVVPADPEPETPE